MKQITQEYKRALFFKTVGNFLILSSLFFIFRLLYQPVIEEIRYLSNTVSGKQFIVETEEIKETIDISSINTNNLNKTSDSLPKKGEFARLLSSKNIEILEPQDTNFSIVVPKIGANSRIIKDVSTTEKDVYLEALKSGVAHASGTAFPGEGGHIFLFAHSTDFLFNITSYNAVFYLLYKLEVGDEVNLFFNGSRYLYKVTGKQIVDPKEVEYLTKKTDKEFLTLQTCWPPGTTFKRQLIFAEPVLQ